MHFIVTLYIWVCFMNPYANHFRDSKVIATKQEVFGEVQFPSMSPSS